MTTHSDRPRPAGAVARLGACVQGLALGILVFIAIWELLAVAGAIRLFRYQAF